MFGQYFNIDESVFSIAPNPKYLFLSKQHEEALAHLIYGVTRKGGFVCLTGDIGTGKTTICRCMFEQLPENTDIAFVINPKFSPMELLASICDELHIGYSPFQPSIREYVKKLNTYLVEAHSRGRNTALVIDEAQNLSIEALEHVRALTNLETNEQKLLQIILIGQPELKTLLAKPELEQVNQRITARFHIGPLSLNESNHYINHRLLVAGAKEKIFSAANIKQIYRLSKGVPRRINILCDRVLLVAYTIRKSKISSQIITQSAEEVFGDVPVYSNLFPKALAASIFVVLISALGVFAFQNYMIDSPAIQSSLAVFSENKIALTPDADEVKTFIGDVTEVVKAEVKSAEVSEVNFASTIKAEKLIINQKEINERKANYVTKNIAKSEPIKVNVSAPVKDVVKEVKKSTLENNAPKLVSNEKVLQFTGYGKAYQQLFRLWAVDYSSTEVSPCEHAFNNQLHCYQSKGSIKNIIGLNRPVLLKSKSELYEPSYMVVVSIEGDYAIVSEKGDYQLVAISDIEANWSGEFEMLWRPLRAGVSYIKPGQKGKAVALLDQKLAKLQGRKSLTSHPFVYSEDLVNQVRAFQIANKLPSDGVVGPITQMYFNNKNIDTPYLIK
ncbi:MAG: AAA family ATPase [Gammaproteobacteria bacterium]|nr:MAG: AAA family ATPase [Gammaproteobacteria bacterium]